MTCGYSVLYFFFSWLTFSDHSFQQQLTRTTLACDLVVDAGPDITLCEPDEVTLMGSVIGETVSIEWTPSTGLSDPFILTPTADINGTITYTLTAWGFDPDNPNLVVNGDFESGNTGFTSDYTYLPDLPGFQLMDEGEYGVLTDPFNVHGDWAHCGDHTTGSSNLMVLNGAPDYQDVWCQSIDVMPGTYYNVAAWVASVHPVAPAILQFSINGSTIGDIINAPSTTCEWVPFNAIWFSGTNTTADLCILNQNTTVFGNDFAIDDISMVELCFVEDEVTITIEPENAPEPVIEGPAVLCAGETATYTADLPSTPEIISYQWNVPSGATIVSGQGTNEITIEWDEALEGTICLEIETECDENEGCFEVVVNAEPEEPEIIGALPLCPGDAINLFSFSNSGEEYFWTVTPEVEIISGQGTNEIEIQWAQPGEAEICLEASNECGEIQSCVTLITSPSYNTVFDTMLCPNVTIVINGTVYGNGVWSGVEDFLSVDGCDSTVIVEISEAPGTETMRTEFICPGDSIFLEGMYQTEADIYIDSFTNASGCDSVVITDLIVSAIDSNYIFSTTCLATEAGIFISTFNNGNCDSVVVHEITFIASDTTYILGNTCDPAQVVNDIDTLLNAGGCDSFVVTTIIFSEADTTMIAGTTCDLQTAGNSTLLLSNSEGCDSLVITSIEYVGSDTLFLFGNTCFVSDTGRIITQHVNQFGCDSIVSEYLQLIKSDTTYLNAFTCEPADTGTIAQLFANTGGCDSLVITSTALDAPDNCFFNASLEVEQPLCFGDTAWIHIDFLAGATPFQLFWENGMQSGSQTVSSQDMVSLPFMSGGEVRFTLISANGLLILDTLQVDQPQPLLIDGYAVSSYSGYNVPCFNDSVAEIQLDVISQGTPPLSVLWSHGETVADPIGIPAGLYAVTVTDANGCTATEEVIVTQPPAIVYELYVTDIPCSGETLGHVQIINATGGVLPWMVTVDGDSMSNNGFPAGMHTVLVTDKNGCTGEASFIINEPSDWDLSLGADTTLNFGSWVTISANITGVPEGPLGITWSDGQCPNCLSRDLQITESFSLQVTAVDSNGCSVTDVISFFLSIDGDVFIPNVFTPDGDDINDYFFISAGEFVEEIQELSIYDRWGDHVFQKFNFQPNQPLLGWDGTMRNLPMNPAVFAYKALIKFKDGSSEWRYGDVTIVR